MIIKNAEVFQEDGNFVIKDIFIDVEYIIGKSESRDNRCKKEALGEDGRIINAAGLYAIPGLIGLHFHGCINHDFCDASHESLKKIAEYQLYNGITSIVPATMTLDEETIHKICMAAATYESDSGAELMGINLEDPFISRKKKGAQDEKFIRQPDIEIFRRIQESAGGMVKIICIAPEENGALKFIKELSKEAVLSLAHTDSDYETACKAL